MRKRRVYHIANAAGIDAAEALQRLRDAGFAVARVTDLVAKSSFDNAMRVVSSTGQAQPTMEQGSTNSVAKDTSNRIARRLPTRRSTRTIPRRKDSKRRSPVHYLSAQQVVDIHFTLVDMFAKDNDPIFPPGPKDEGLLESATFRPQTALGNTEKYETIYSKAAAMFHSLVLNHPFHNGNKRTALVSLVVFLDINGLQIDASDDDLFDFVIRTAKRHDPEMSPGGADQEVQRVQSWLRSHGSRTDDQPKEMNVTDFLAGVEAAGGMYRKSAKGSKWIVWGPNGDSVSFGQGFAKLQGSVVKRYMQRLGLSHGMSGIHFDEFHEGLNPEQKLIRRFRLVLQRLAHT